MKEERENRLDAYFRDGLDNLNVIPPADVWNNIAANLPVKKNNRKMFVWIAAAASVALFAALSGWFYSRYEGVGNADNTSHMAIKQPTPLESNSTGSISENKKQDNKSTSLDKVNTPKQTIIANTSKPGSKVSSSENSKSVNNQVSVPADSSDKLNLATTIINNNESSEEQYVNALPEKTQQIALLKARTIQKLSVPAFEVNVTAISVAITKDTTTVYDNLYALNIVEEPVAKKDRWAIGGQMAPLYSYRNISEVNTPGLSKSSMDQIEKAVVTYASGILVDYEATSRLTFQTGVYYMKMGQTIENISNFSGPVTKSSHFAEMNSAKNLIQPGVSNSTGTIVTPSEKLYFYGTANSDRMEYAPGNLALSPADAESKDIQQSFEFIEVPFLAKYKVLNRKINLHLLGGVSTHFLVNNKTTLHTSEGTSQGKTENVESTNYSSSVGFGVVYNLRKNLFLSVEPTFKYYINSFNTSSAVKLHPYAFGLYSGVSFKF